MSKLVDVVLQGPWGRGQTRAYAACKDQDTGRAYKMKTGEDNCAPKGLVFQDGI